MQRPVQRSYLARFLAVSLLVVLLVFSGFPTTSQLSNLKTTQQMSIDELELLSEVLAWKAIVGQDLSLRILFEARLVSQGGYSLSLSNSINLALSHMSHKRFVRVFQQMTPDQQAYLRNATYLESLDALLTGSSPKSP